MHALHDVPHTCARAATEPVERVRLPQHLVAELARGGVEGGAAESCMVGEDTWRPVSRLKSLYLYINILTMYNINHVPSWSGKDTCAPMPAPRAAARATVFAIDSQVPT